MKPIHLALALPLLAFAPPALAAPAATLPASTLPFVGCIESGPLPGDVSWTAPTGKPLPTRLPPAIAAHLAVYASNWSAVLAPRGWVCRSTVTPLQGVAMIVAPAGAVDDALPATAQILNGPAIIAWNDQRPTIVAAYAGRYFPGRAPQSPVQQAALTPPSPLYRDDVIRRVRGAVLEYTTPPHRAGLGSQTSLPGGSLPALPSYGVLALSSLPRGAGGIVNLTVRLPANLAFLRGAIIKPFEACLPSRNTLACESRGAAVAQGRPLDDGD